MSSLACVSLESRPRYTSRSLFTLILFTPRASHSCKRQGTTERTCQIAPATQRGPRLQQSSAVLFRYSGKSQGRLIHPLIHPFCVIHLCSFL